MKACKMFVGLAALAFTVSLTACNTAEGIGEDLSGGGEAIADTARDIQD